MIFPDLIPIKRNLEYPVLDNLEAVINTQLRKIKNISSEDKIAITVGSRGINNLVPILRSTIKYLKTKKAKPFVVAAMGSHGGATTKGQLELLKGYGVTYENLGVPVVGSTETVKVPNKLYSGEIWISKEAFAANSIIVLNRIKKHTDLFGPIQSGLCKMLAIGLGNQKQAETLHNEGLQVLSDSIPLIASDVLQTGKILCGIGIVENGKGDTASLDVLEPSQIITKEKELLVLANKLTPKLPVNSLDVLIIDEGGKNYSGSCIDTNVIGRMRLEGEQDLSEPSIHRVVVTDLSEESQGNAAGIGLADFITKKFYDKIDFHSTYTNCLSCIFPERGKIPMVIDNDKEAATVALNTCRLSRRLNPSIIRIHDTLNLEKMWVSKNLLDEISTKEKIEVLSDPVDIFDKYGELIDF
jgi:hypothetical protein